MPHFALAPSSCSLLLVGMLVGGCDRSPTRADSGGQASDASEPAPAKAAPSDSAEAVAPPSKDTAALGPATGSDAPSAPPTPPPAEPPPEPAKPLTFAEKVAPLIGDAKPDATAEKTAWTHYKAKRYVEAQRSFALASLHDRAAWKHPFNLACASALALDEAMVRVALIEAVERDSSTVGSKARSDADLAAYRSKNWFEPILRGEDPTQTSAAPPADQPDQPATPDQPAAPPAPPVPPGKPLPAGVAKPLAKAQVELIRDELKKVHGLRPVVRGSLETTGAQGEAIAFVVYDYTNFDFCALTKSKNACRRELGSGIADGVYEEPENPIDEMKCTQQYLARVTLGEAPIIATPQRLAVACIGNKVNRIDLVDIDGDGQQEVVVDVSGQIQLDTYREGTLLDIGRVIRILRLDGSSQFEFKLAWEAYEIAPGTEQSKRVRARDINEDGHLDLLIEAVAFTALADGEFDRDFWPTGDDEEQEIEPLPTKVLLYDATKDAWIE